MRWCKVVNVRSYRRLNVHQLSECHAYGCSPFILVVVVRISLDLLAGSQALSRR